jgi:arsenate reductase-like glutaredoxin family protein
VSDLFVTKGKKTLHFDVASARPPDDELLALLLGRSGKLRAPAIKVSGRLLVGYNESILSDHLGCE